MKMAKGISKHKKAFTLVELLVALTVSAIVLGAVASIAYAMGSADVSGSDISEKQAQVRYATVRITELIKHSRLMCAGFPLSLAFWSGDTNGNGKINPGELVYMETDSGRGYLMLCEFSAVSPAAEKEITIAEIQSGAAKTWLLSNCQPNYTVLISQGSNVTFLSDQAGPYTRLVAVSFDIAEDGVSRTYQIAAAIRCAAFNLLDAGGQIAVSDDD